MFDTLESRRLFSIAVVDGTLTIRGTTANEKLYVAWKKTSATTWDMRVFDGRKRESWSYSGHNSWDQISIYGGNGNDYMSATATLSGFTNTFEPPVTILMNGGAGNDRLHGGEGDDYMLGGSGNDFLFGHGGDDQMFGEFGRDSLDGGDGNDSILGEDGNDSVTGDTGDDVISGGDGNDLLDGGEGNDLIAGDAGADALFAGTTSMPPYFRGSNIDLGMDTLYGSTMGDPDDVGDELFY